MLDYWGTPMHVTALEHAFWCRTDADVLAFLELNHAPLREQGYTHTVVPDRRVFAYNSVGGAVEVIWSRRATPTKARSSAGQRISTWPRAKPDGGSSESNRRPRNWTASKRSGRSHAHRKSTKMPEPTYPPLVMPDNVERRTVTLWSNGIALDGDVFRPTKLAHDAALPAVVLCHGWGGSKLTGERYAALFAAAGIIALTFTQGSWFGSGSPLQLVGDTPELDHGNEATVRVRFIRDLVDPVAWTANLRVALSFLEGEPNVDRDRIGVWGTSFGGGIAVHVAATDARVKTLAVQVPALTRSRVAWPITPAKRRSTPPAAPPTPYPRASTRPRRWTAPPTWRPSRTSTPSILSVTCASPP